MKHSKYILIIVLLTALTGCDDDGNDENPVVREVIWSRELHSDWGECISPTNDGGFVALGSSGWSGFLAVLFRYTADGEIVDSASLSTLAEDHNFACAKAANGGMWIAFKSNGLVLQRYDENLDLVLSTTHPEYNWKVMRLSDTHAGLVAACQVEDSTRFRRTAIVMLDYQGGAQSAHMVNFLYDVPENVTVTEYVYDIATSSTGTMYLGGTQIFGRSFMISDSSDAFVLTANTQGEIQGVWAQNESRRESAGLLYAMQNGSILAAITALNTSNYYEQRFIQLAPNGDDLAREDLNSWAGYATIAEFLPRSNGSVIAIGYENHSEFSCDLVVGSMSSECAPVWRVEMAEGVQVIQADLLTDGSLILFGFYPTDSFPTPTYVLRVRI